MDKKFLEQGATIKARVGGERCKPFGRHKSQKIKNLFQEFKIPDWKRDFIPLIYIGDRIAAVGDLWVSPTSSFIKAIFRNWQKMHSYFLATAPNWEQDRTANTLLHKPNYLFKNSLDFNRQRNDIH